METMYRFPSATREQPKHRLCTSLKTASNRGNTARGASIPANQHGTCRGGRRAQPLQREEPDVNQAQEPSQPLHVENREILPEATLDDA